MISTDQVLARARERTSNTDLLTAIEDGANSIEYRRVRFDAGSSGGVLFAGVIREAMLLRATADEASFVATAHLYAARANDWERFLDELFYDEDEEEVIQPALRREVELAWAGMLVPGQRIYDGTWVRFAGQFGGGTSLQTFDDDPATDSRPLYKHIIDRFSPVLVQAAHVRPEPVIKEHVRTW